MLKIQKAVKEQIDLRAAITGPTGAGKTYTALRLAFELAGPHGKVLVIDTERKSARKYEGEVPDGFPWAYDVIEMPDFSPSTYTEAIEIGIDHQVIIIDSLSHAWEGPGGILELQQKHGGRYQDWAKVNPLHFGLIDAILTAPGHMIVTMRSKMEYALNADEESGKLKVQKVGLAPVQRKGIEYEFDFILDMDWSNTATINKTRCSSMRGKSAVCPGPGFFKPLIEWLNTGEPVYHFDNPKLLFRALEDDFGLDRERASEILKEQGFNGFRPSSSNEIYQAVKQAYEAEKKEEVLFDVPAELDEPIPAQNGKE